MNIAIFGGSFDPPHIGHEKIVYEALKILNINELIIVPTYLNPFKSSFKIDPHIRLDLIKKMFDDIPKVNISAFEINQKRAVFAVESVEHFKNLYKPNKIYLIIGADNLEKLHLWHQFNKLNTLVEFVVVGRRGLTSKKNIDIKIIDTVDIDVSSTTLREELDIKYIPKKIQKEVKDIWPKD